MKKKIAVIGAGLAGITFAYIMKEQFNVKIFEKSRGVGGRMSTRKETPFYFHYSPSMSLQQNKYSRKLKDLDIKTT